MIHGFHGGDCDAMYLLEGPLESTNPSHLPPSHSLVPHFTASFLIHLLFLLSVLQLLVTANVVSSSMILFTLLIEATRSSETSVFTRATRRHIPEDDILHSHRRENLKSYIALTG
jgi:hypothetical protein